MKNRILYLDDDKELLNMYSQIIEDWGYQIDISDNPHDTFHNLRNSSNRYSHLLIDYKMPLINGVEFLHIISFESFFNIPHIALFSSIANSPMVQKELFEKVPPIKKKIHAIDKNLHSTQSLKLFLSSNIEETEGMKTLKT